MTLSWILQPFFQTTPKHFPTSTEFHHLTFPNILSISHTNPLSKMWFLLTALWWTPVWAIKFCTNRYIPSGSCPSNAAEICAASGNHCFKSDPVAYQYSVEGVSGCAQFQTGGHSGEECSGMHVGDAPGEASCYPYNRNYCECTVCTHHANCSTFHGLPTGCEGMPAGSGLMYAQGFADGKRCGVEHCADSLRDSYQRLGTC